MAKKFKLEFSGFEELSARLEELGGDLKATTEQALQSTHGFITPKLQADMGRHRRTGKTAASIIKNTKVQWAGDVASIDVGFNLSNGGMPSIFLMYGTPRMRPDKKLYNDIYGSRTKKEVAELQEKTVMRAIQKKLGG